MLTFFKVVYSNVNFGFKCKPIKLFLIFCRILCPKKHPTSYTLATHAKISHSTRKAASLPMETRRSRKFRRRRSAACTPATHTLVAAQRQASCPRSGCQRGRSPLHSLRLPVLSLSCFLGQRRDQVS